MASSFLDVLARPSALRKAWQKISKGKLNKPGAARVGHDGQSLESFARRLEAEISVISRELRAGKYAFSKLDPYFIPKKDGKERVICVPTVADRLVQRAILDSISAKQRWQTNPVSYGFVTDGGVERAVMKAVEYRGEAPWVFKTDITKFFDRVSRDLLRSRIRLIVKQRSVIPLLLAAVDCEIRPRRASHVARIRALGIVEGRGVRQGMPLSPFFANLFLADFDRLCIERKIKALRYADDLICFAQTKSVIEEIAVFCKTELQKIELEIPDIVSGAKSQICSPVESVEFLGVELATKKVGGYEVRVGQRQLGQIKHNLYMLGSLKELKDRRVDMANFGAVLAGTVAGYTTAYDFCANHAQLVASLGIWRREVVRSVAKELGIDVANLSPDGKAFFGFSD